MNIKRVFLMAPPTTRSAEIEREGPRDAHPVRSDLGYLAAVPRDRYEVKVLDCLLEGVEREPWKMIFPVLDLTNVVRHSPENTITMDEWGRLIDQDGNLLPLFGQKEMLRYGMRDAEIREAIAGFNPDVVGVSSIFSDSDWDAKNICRIAKAVATDIVTVVVGAHAEACAQEILDAEPAVDYVVIGEGERALGDLLAALERGRVHSVDGLAYRHAGRVADHESVGEEAGEVIEGTVLAEIIKALLDREPISEGEHWADYCVLCGASYLDIPVTQDRIEHGDDCPWLRLKEYMEEVER